MAYDGRKMFISVEDRSALLGDYYELEFCPSGAPYRWTGPGLMFGFGLELDRRCRWKGRLVYERSLSPHNDANLLLEVDKTFLELTTENEHAFLLPRKAKQAHTELHFFVQETCSPRFMRLGEDTRALGLMVRGLLLEAKSN